MVDLNKLNKPALSAAMRGGTEGWGEMGSSTMNVRYIDLAPSMARRRCHCGCDGRATHRGLANGVCLVSGCQMAILRWVKTGSTTVRTVHAPSHDVPTDAEALAVILAHAIPGRPSAPTGQINPD